MATELIVPTLGESISEATVAKWFKAVGEPFSVDDPLVELETDKVTVEVPAPVGGALVEIKAEEGAEVEVGAVLGMIGDADGKAAAPAAAEASEKKPETTPEPAPAEDPQPAAAADEGEAPLSPAVQRLVAENDLDPAAIPASGKNGRLTKGDVLDYLEKKAAMPEPAKAEAAPAKADAAPAPAAAADPREERVRMTRLRKRIAERLKEAQNTAAMLTTFNEVDMTRVMALRATHKDAFEKKHGVRLGFMSFFARASIIALKEIPAVNASIDGDEIVYKNHYDLGVAVGTPQGLVVPVVRDADKMSFAEIEGTIAELGRKARDGKLTMEDLSGGTFTISNGGVYGSLMSTPILNTPQSGILGMHKTMMRPMVVGDKVEPRPMMYLALSYDHRVIDGREAVTFLVRVKECLEDPERILLDM
ncbi:MAG: 2-oxoglutarate dehydrogenase complex dihydrolipoyllysine-residue succinyltransferase [Alphaproteobacteria bacterium]|nr:2-oxoglutarate dehydrogenase complex dihydrolipoyllysine-residue succinyltransferase [Alphaproteobacteria bacterium]